MTLIAGAATREITPLQPQFLLGYPHVPRMAETTHDPLLASALFLAEGETGMLLIALDLLFLSAATARRYRESISVLTGVPVENILMSCTHTHSAPVTFKLHAWRGDPVVPEPDPQFMEWLGVQISEAATAAVQAARPAELCATKAYVEGVGTNRLHPDAIRDNEVDVIGVRKAGQGHWIALNLVYAMHPTVLHEDSRAYSGDFPAFTRLRLREALGDALVVLYHTGACGNQSPRYHVKGQTFAEAERLGRRLGEFVAGAVRQITDEEWKAEIVLASASESVELVPRAFAPLDAAHRTLAAARAELARLRAAGAAHGPVRTAECAVFGAEELVTLAELQDGGELAALIDQYREAEIQILRLGPVDVVGIPGEIFVEYGLEIKARATRPTQVITYANGELQGYIVTPEADAQGGYEAACSLFRPESGAALVNAALRGLARLDKSRSLLRL